MRHPLNNFTVTSHFGVPRPGGRHSGTDYISADPYIYAIEDGRIERRFDTVSGWGLNLFGAGGRKWEYLHLFQTGLAGNGTTVREGDRIGKWGETEVADVDGAHCHLGFQINQGAQLDGFKYIEDHSDMTCNPDRDDVNDFFSLLKGLPGQIGVPTTAQVNSYTKQPWQVLAGDCVKTATNAYKEGAKPLPPGKWIAN